MTSRAAALLACLALGACGAPAPERPEWQCQDVGAFRYAMNISKYESKVVTTRGEFVVYGNVSGLWGTPVQDCRRQLALGGTERQVRMGWFGYRAE